MSPPDATAANPSNDTPAKVYTCELTVRGYELDSFAHVNHAVYISYLEHARWQLLADAGVTLATLNTLKRWPVIGEIEVKYLKPTYMGDHLTIESRLLESGRTSYRIEHKVFKNGTTPIQVLLAKVLVVTVNESGRPAETPDVITQLWK